MLPNHPGIYCIENVETGHVYVGSAANMAARLSDHIAALDAGRHHSPHLQRAWSKHGQELFDAYAVEIVPEPERLTIAEQGWIDRLDACNPAKGYNVCKIAARPREATTARRTKKYKPRCCNECASEYTPRRADEFYCSTKCRKDFDNRRMVRGRELYDLFMALRYERGLAKAAGVWAIACRMAQSWREEDERTRGGRKSWLPVKRVLARLPVTMTEVDVFITKDRTGRGGVR